MKRRSKSRWFFTAATLVLSGSVLATLLVSFSWGARIHGKAFHCTDDTGAMLGFFDDLAVHKKEGDRLGEGWTWRKIEKSQANHLRAFWIISLSPLIIVGGLQIADRLRK